MGLQEVKTNIAKDLAGMKKIEAIAKTLVSENPESFRILPHSISTSTELPMVSNLWSGRSFQLAVDAVFDNGIIINGVGLKEVDRLDSKLGYRLKIERGDKVRKFMFDSLKRSAEIDYSDWPEEQIELMDLTMYPGVDLSNLDMPTRYLSMCADTNISHEDAAKILNGGILSRPHNRSIVTLKNYHNALTYPQI